MHGFCPRAVLYVVREWEGKGYIRIVGFGKVHGFGFGGVINMRDGWVGMGMGMGIKDGRRRFGGLEEHP